MDFKGLLYTVVHAGFELCGGEESNECGLTKWHLYIVDVLFSGHLCIMGCLD